VSSSFFSFLIFHLVRAYYTHALQKQRSPETRTVPDITANPAGGLPHESAVKRNPASYLKYRDSSVGVIKSTSSANSNQLTNRLIRDFPGSMRLLASLTLHVETEDKRITKVHGRARMNSRKRSYMLHRSSRQSSDNNPRDVSLRGKLANIILRSPSREGNRGESTRETERSRSLAQRI